MSRRNGLRPVTLGKARLSNSPKGTYHGHAFSVQSISHPRRNLHGQNTLGPGLSFAVRNCGGSARALYRGPVWRVTLVRVKPAQMDAYLTSLRQATKPLLEEEKRTGPIVDYKIFLKETNSGPQDWDLALAIEYKNHAAMDGLTAKGEAVRDKIMGGKQQAQQVAEKRQEIREVVSSELLQEIMLK